MSRTTGPEASTLFQVLMGVVFLGLFVTGIRAVANGDWLIVVLAGVPGLVGLLWLLGVRRSGQTR
jgi:uncharacterized membrane protein YjjP (DUF1212 family)